MARYADLMDNEDPVIALAESDLTQADAWVDAQLQARGIDPALADSDHPLLNRLALHQALILAATRSQGDEGGVLAEKIRHYRALLEADLKLLSRRVLGLSSGGYGTATLGRA